MKQNQATRHNASKQMYDEPKIDLFTLPREDIVTTSGSRDENQGEWDSQEIDYRF